MFTPELEKQLVGKTVTVNNQQYTVLGLYVTEAAGLVLVVVSQTNGKAFLSTLRVVGGNIELS